MKGLRCPNTKTDNSFLSPYNLAADPSITSKPTYITFNRVGRLLVYVIGIKSAALPSTHNVCPTSDDEHDRWEGRVKLL